ncbi:MAG: hypothetical protein IKF17_05665 [Clostridia bacterium]|nr:hypothetical protein [Clostridia bacterium]
MDIEEKETIEKQFERNLELLVRGKFPLTATAIVAAEQPMILLFKELIHRIEKREYEIDKKESDLYEVNNRMNDLLEIADNKDKIINEMAESIFLMNGDRGCTKQEKIDYFTKKVEGK